MARAWKPIHTTADGRCVMEAVATIVAGDPVKLATNGVDVAGDGDAVFGVAAVDIASGSTGTILTEGTFGVTFGATIVMGARVAAAASKQVDAGTTSDPSCGIVVTADVTSGNVGEVLLSSSRNAQVAI
jgi:predicted RecA/RadA family phage recombinase